LSVVDHNSIELSPRISEAAVADYIALLKPRVMSLVVFTALVGLMIAPVHVHPVLAFTSILCIAVGAGASGALNMWYESDIDAKMSRTANRPIPRGRVTRPEALAFGMTLAFYSVMTLGILVNWFAGALLAFTIFFYVVVYTMALKRWTAQNIVIGGAAGALPPVVAWAAATGSLSVEPILLSSGPRRISGPWRCSAATITPAPACRCCRSSPAPTRRGCRFFFIRSCWSRSHSRPGRSVISTRYMA
jgi:protoheme IX farnesyltransferase